MGDPPRFYDPETAAILDSAAFGVAAVGATIGLLLAVIVASRRSLHRARLGRVSSAS
ncbi:MAG TPA: hypothetical protein VFZ32_05020 [Micromonosporaceae bacterium]